MKYYSTAPATASYTVGTGGTGAAAGSNVGSAGGSTTFNSEMNLGGGAGGSWGEFRSDASSRPPTYSRAGLGGSPDAGDLSDIKGNGGSPPPGMNGPWYEPNFTTRYATTGGSSFLGPGANPAQFDQAALTNTASSAVGLPGVSPGSGGGGAVVSNNGATGTGTARAGGNGKSGIIIVYEYS